MKVISIMGILAGWVGLAVLGGSPAYSQSEVAPDHFESSNVEPFEKLSLANWYGSAQCHIVTPKLNNNSPTTGLF